MVVLYNESVETFEEDNAKDAAGYAFFGASVANAN